MIRVLSFLLLLTSPALFSAQTLQALLADPAMAHASLSACVIDVESGKIVASHDPERSLPPGSTQKLITTATALARTESHTPFTAVSRFGARTARPGGTPEGSGTTSAAGTT